MTVTKFETQQMLNQISLKKAGLWRIDGDLRGEKLTCTAGQLWVTQRKDFNDYILSAGDIFWVTRPGTILVQAMKDGQFTFSRMTAAKAPSHN